MPNVEKSATTRSRTLPADHTRVVRAMPPVIVLHPDAALARLGLCVRSHEHRTEKRLEIVHVRVGPQMAARIDKYVGEIGCSPARVDFGEVSRLGEKRIGNRLVFLGLAGACGVDQAPAATDTGGGVSKDCELRLGQPA